MSAGDFDSNKLCGEPEKDYNQSKFQETYISDFNKLVKPKHSKETTNSIKDQKNKRD